MKKLTNKQTVILDYIKVFIENHGFSPTIREIGENFEMSVIGAYDHVRAIENKGHIIRNRKTARSILIPNHKIDIDESVVENNKFYKRITNEMVKLPRGKRCIICGSKDKIERHHEDYNFPELTIDLCRKHHRELHKIKNILSHSGYEFTITKKQPLCSL